MFRRLLVLVFLLFPLTLWALSSNNSTDPLRAEALMAYPLKIRQAVIEVSLYPKLIEEIRALQQNSARQFQSWIAPFDRKQQIELYQLSRFPKLINEIVVDAAGNPKQIETLSQVYPKEIHHAALTWGTQHLDLLKKINDLNQSNNQQFSQLLQGYPPEAKQAFMILLQHPDTLDILTKNPGLAAQLGTLAKQQNPTAQKKFSALSPELQQKNTVALDPQAAALQAAAKSFTDKADTEFNEVLDPSKAAQMNVNYDPYYSSYWSLTPGFYDNPYWYGAPGWGYGGWSWYD